jgi:PKD repeat protein
MTKKLAVALAAVLASVACTVHKTEAPPLAGPSTFALSLEMSATPDSITQDGGSQSSIKVTAIGANGQAVSGLTLRLNMQVNGVLADFGTLSARTIVTGSDGSASTVYTAPPRPVGVNTPTCPGEAQEPGTCVTIVATPTGTNFDTANAQLVTIRLVPPGVILPPVGKPTASFTFSPSPPSVSVPLIFDASSSRPGQNSSQITSYSWTFGDGSTSEVTTPTITHTFTSGGTFHVSLTVTNDRGLPSDPFPQDVVVGTSDPFTGDWTLSPTAPNLNQPVVFNATQVQTSAGHDVVRFSWNFGDGGTGLGAVTSHAYAAAGSYGVVLTVTDDLGRTKVFNPKTANVATGPPPSGDWVNSPVSPVINETVTFNAAAVQPAPGRTIAQYEWNFGDGKTGTGQVTSHVFTAANQYAVVLTVTDDVGQKLVLSHNLTVSPGNPTAKLTLTKAGAFSITADGSLSTAVGSAQIVDYTFNWGDGSPNSSGTAAVVPHTFPAAGTYTVTFTVTDNFGTPRRGTITQSITVP